MRKTPGRSLTASRAAACLFIILLLHAPCWAKNSRGSSSTFPVERKVLFFEDFKNLSVWSPLYFPKIKRHSKYAAAEAGGITFLRTESVNSASAIIHKAGFNVYEFPWLRFRVLVSNVYKKGNALKKSGDDYPVRIYVMFKYDPERAGFWERIKYNSARLLYGNYPPYASLNYIWANRKHARTILENPYTDRARMIIIESGTKNLHRWMEYQVNMLRDFELTFGEKPPALAQIAVMNDSDNTGEASVSMIDFIEVSNAPVEENQRRPGP